VVELSSQTVSSPSEPLIVATALRLAFAGLVALDAVSFDVRHGEIFAVIGPNGAGKTSIFNCISGVYHPQQGSISFEGRELIGMRPYEVTALGIARTFQNIELFPLMTVVDNLMLGRHRLMTSGFISGGLWRGKARTEEIEHRQRVEEIIDFLEIEKYRATYVSMLPYGLQKRVELGRALAMEPRLLLLDEPVAGMNVEETEDMARFILDVSEELGITQILVDHDMGVVMDIADRVMALDFGRRIAMGTPDEVQSNPDVIKAYLGEQHAVEAKG
jgi:branched-chain amino acid transport system ATP-binding protein